MERAVVLSVGREVLRGATLDTNAHFLAGALTRLGAEVVRIAVVDDDPPAIAREFRLALDLAPRVVVSSGGLGPTFDDRTVEGLALALGVGIRVDPTAREWVVASYRGFAERGLVASADLSPEREKMARLPEGATPVRNPAGAAPAVLVETRGATIACLPGVPDEMRALWAGGVESAIRRALPPASPPGSQDVPLATRDESTVAPILRALMDEFPGVHAKSRVSGTGGSIRIVVTLTAGGGAAATLSAAAVRLRELVARV